MKAILIARVSTEEQKEAGNSLPAQITRLERYCLNKGSPILKTCSFDESAYKNQRSEFDQILDYILEQQTKLVVCCDKVDRLSRNIFDKRIALLYEKALRDEIELHFVSEGQVVNGRISASEKFQFGISLNLANYYSDAISDNVKRALEQKIRKGEWIAKAPYGYKHIVNKDGTKSIVVDDFESHIIKKVYEMYATGIYSMHMLCEKLKTDFSIEWKKSFLDKVLKNHFYYGIMVIKGKKYPHRYPPLISQTVFEQVQDVKKSFNKKPCKYAGRPYIYRGMIRCADCGLAVTPEKHKGHVYYHCTQYNGKHGAKWLREEEITRQLGAVFKRMQMPKEIAAQVVETLKETHKSQVEFHKQQHTILKREHKTVSTMIENLYMDKLKGSITESEYDKFYQTLREKLEDVNIRIDQLQEADENYYITSKYVIDLTSRAYDLFKSSEVEEKRQLIKLILSNLQLKDEKLVWEMHKPFDLIVNLEDDVIWRP